MESGDVQQSINWVLNKYPQVHLFLSLPKDIFLIAFFFLFIERGHWGEKKKERERERNISVRDKHELVAFSHVPQPGIEPTTQACALTGN